MFIGEAEKFPKTNAELLRLHYSQVMALNLDKIVQYFRFDDFWIQVS